MCRFEILRVLVLDNDTQFYANSFKKFYQDLHIKQKFNSVEYLQTNGLVESANQTFLERPRKRLDLAKREWVKELTYVLW